jgi:hypothetical protein
MSAAASTTESAMSHLIPRRHMWGLGGADDLSFLLGKFSDQTNP